MRSANGERAPTRERRPSRAMIASFSAVIVAGVIAIAVVAGGSDPEAPTVKVEPTAPEPKTVMPVTPPEPPLGSANTGANTGSNTDDAGSAGSAAPAGSGSSIAVTPTKKPPKKPPTKKPPIKKPPKDVGESRI